MAFVTDDSSLYCGGFQRFASDALATVLPNSEADSLMYRFEILNLPDKPLGLFDRSDSACFQRPICIPT